MPVSKRNMRNRTRREKKHDERIKKVGDRLTVETLKEGKKFRAVGKIDGRIVYVSLPRQPENVAKRKRKWLKSMAKRLLGAA